MRKLHAKVSRCILQDDLDDAGEGRSQGSICIARKASEEDAPELQLIQWNALVPGQELKGAFQQSLHTGMVSCLEDLCCNNQESASWYAICKI